MSQTGEMPPEVEAHVRELIRKEACRLKISPRACAELFLLHSVKEREPENLCEYLLDSSLAAVELWEEENGALSDMERGYFAA